MMIPHTPIPHTGTRCNKAYPHSHPWRGSNVDPRRCSSESFRALLPPPRPEGWSVNPKVGPGFRLPLPRPPSSVASPKRGDRKEKNRRRRETRRRVADAKAKAKERERPQITVATVIQKPGEKKGVPKPNMKGKSKESQVLDVLKKYMPKEKVRLAMFHELMPIVKKGGTQRERRKKIIVKREEKAVEDVKVATESQKVAEAEKDVAEKTAEEIEAEKAAEEIKAQKVAEEESLITAAVKNFFEELLAEMAAEIAIQVAAAEQNRLDRSRRAREARELADDFSDWMREHNCRDCPCHFDWEEHYRYCDRCEAKSYQEQYYYNVVIPWRELCR